MLDTGYIGQSQEMCKYTNAAYNACDQDEDIGSHEAPFTQAQWRIVNFKREKSFWRLFQFMAESPQPNHAEVVTP